MTTPRTQTRDVTVRGVRIRAIEAGPKDAPALVLIHGFLVSQLEWADVLPALAERFHVIAPDLPGFGESEKPGPARYPYGIDTFAEAIADLVAAFGVGRAHVMGHSMGGAVALTLAADHPELVQRLVVVDPLVYPFETSLKARLVLYPFIGPVIFKQLYGRGMFRAYFRDEVFNNGAGFDLARIDEHYERFNSPAARESAYATLRSLQDTRALVARLGRIRMPSLVVWGRDDKLFPVAHASRLAKDLSDARLEVLPTGHSPGEELPEVFLGVINEFLEGRR
jgi:pimeloyl-ACP methyl ester carboxylesterase